MAVAASAGLAGFSTDYPAAAVAAWDGPGNEPDVRRWALGYAILAPNSHNRQPWLADLREPNAIVLHVDRQRLLPETDPWFRQIVVSQGTFLEALVIALQERGVVPQVQLFPQGEFAPRALDDRPVARISWAPTAPASPAPAKDPLFAQLLRRNAAKVAYDPARPVAEGTLTRLRAALVDPHVAYDGTVDAARLPALRQLCLDAGRVEAATARTAMESQRLLRIGPREIAEHRDGISINTPMARVAAAVGLFDRSATPTVEGTGFKQTMARYDDFTRTAMGFVWLSTPWARDASAGTTRSAEVRAGRAYMRLQLRATELGLQVHPLSQAPQAFPEMKAHHDALHRTLLDTAPTERVVQMFCRVGYCRDGQHTPRRGVEAIVRT